MGKKKKAFKKELKRQKKAYKAALKKSLPQGYKVKCCDKYKKGDSKRCKKCPCFDLLMKVA